MQEKPAAIRNFIRTGHVHLQNFEFKYDSIPGRRQLGILASATHKELLRDSIHVYPERHVFTQEKRKVAIQNFHAIDKDALFMHNVGATQVLIRRAAEAQMALRSLAVEVAAAQGQLALLQGHLEQEASAVLVEQRKIAEAAVKQVELEIERAKVQGTHATKKVNDLLVAEKEHALHKERIQFEDIQRRDQNKELVRAVNFMPQLPCLHVVVRLSLGKSPTADDQISSVVELQEAASQRMELQRRDTETILKEKQLAADKERMWVEQNTTLEKAVIDVEGRIKQQRLNHDIEMQQLQATLAAEQEKILRALQTAFDNIGNGAMTLLADTDKLLHFVGTVVAVAFGIYLTREIMRIAGRLVEQRLGKPSLKKHNVPYRHLLLYGPPGTGKTMVAKRLAAASGMDYAIMSGGDVDDVGVLIFIDEAEAFLGCRATRKTHMSEAMRNALNALLFHTVVRLLDVVVSQGTQTKQFMLVIATNRPEDLDTAVTDRIDDALHFNLPEAAERLRLMRQYYHDAECVAKLPGGDDPKCETILDKYDKATDGMSGREIAKMMLYMQNMAYAQDTVGVDAALVERVIQDKMDEHKRKASLKAYKDDAPSTE
ncbi:hypothetical protein DYB32_003675 [Aphanomyces invadans]|uniref:AAA+ ATPase domain-containing protein n=1 Tax=Aphanomyces invadans TaxID=157072 RepID=A0A3R6VCU0_9STRA|nr:hypothetical protein DYB32_003675 [Aphanomyces invadans]